MLLAADIKVAMQDKVSATDYKISLVRAVSAFALALPHLNTFNARWCKIFDSQRFVSRIITLKYIDKDNNEDLEKHSWSLAEPPQYAIAKGGEYLVDADGRQTSSCSA